MYYLFYFSFVIAWSFLQFMRGTIIGDKVYLLLYVTQREQYSDYLPTVQKMINSLKITTSNNGLDTEAPSFSA
jgi:hypothetical protein